MEQTPGLWRTAIQTPNGLALIEQMIAKTVEHLRSGGINRCDLDELKARKEGVKAPLYAIAAPPFSETIASDHALAESLRAANRRAETAEARCTVLETRLMSSREQTARLPEPHSITGMALSAVGLFSLCFGSIVNSVFMSSIQDAPLAWVISLLIGAAIGAFLCQAILQPRADARNSKHAIIVGFGLGIGFGILRLSKADGLEDYLIAIGLTVLESIGVVALDWFAERHRQSVSVYRISQAQSMALEQAIADLRNQIRVERDRYDALRAELKQRESEAFDVERVAEYAGWAVEAAYRGAINANQRLLEGGAGFAMPQA